MLLRLSLESLFGRLHAERYTPLFFDPLRWIRSAVVAAVWSGYVLMYTVHSAFAGQVPERWWLESLGMPLDLADRGMLGAPMLDSAATHPEFALYFYAPLILFSLAFICVLLFAFAVAVIRQIFKEIQLILEVLALVAKETVNFALI